MSAPILATKLYFPLPRPGLVPRSRLIERLNEGCAQGCRLTLISASAGFGKTTLLGEWIGHLGKPVAWLSLEKADNDPGRFWTYVLVALRTIQPDLGKDTIELQSTSTQFHSDTVLTTLINEIAAHPDPLLLILDDYHVIDSSSIQEGMIFLLDHLPAQHHLVIASRADPAWPLANWRTRGQLVEIRAADLRFTPEEAADYLKRTMKLDLSIPEIAALEERTEGWIAGLQMAALSLQGREDVREFIAAFTGSNRYIFDYLIEEVLGRQPAEVQDFLLRTSILARLSAPLCDAMLERTDSREMLHRLEKTNLFLIPLDDERHWYRYHHLFTDLLGRSLEQTDHDRIAELHRRASQWYAANDFPAEAIRHALESGNFLLVNDLVTRNAVAVIEHTELLEVLRLFETIPEEDLSSKPWLGVAYAWALMYAGRLQAAVLHLQNAEERSSISGWPGGTDDRIRGHIKAIRAYINLHEGHLNLADELSRGALELLPEMDFMARGFATKTLGLSLRFSDHLQEAEQVSSEAVEIYRAAGINHLTVIALCDLGVVQFMMGKLHQAYATDLEALRLADFHRQEKGGQFPAIGYAYVHLSRLSYYFDQIEESLGYARKGVEFCRRWGLAEFLVDSYSSLAYALSAKRDWAGALEAIQQARQTAMNLSESYLKKWVEPMEVYIHHLMGDLEYVSRWLDHWERSAEKTDQEFIATIDMIRVICLITQGRLDQALIMARLGYEASARSKAITKSITYLTCQAVILHLLHQDDQALEVLGQALSLAESEEYIRVFVDRGQPMYELLVQALHQGLSPGYVEKLLSAFGPGMKITIHPPLEKKPENMGSLSERELEVLRLLESSMNTPEIARELYISVGTVRTHIKNIYCKLDVNRRMEAVRRARELGLI